MSTKIEWANPPGYKGESWPVVTGCTPVSPGCANCWGARLANGRLHLHRCYKGLTRGGKWTGEVRLNEHLLKAPLHWRDPRCVFVCPSSDLFHPDVPFEFIDKVFAVMALCPQHRFLVLTKRPERMAEYRSQIRAELVFAQMERLADITRATPVCFEHVALGVSVEDQQRADERIPILLQCPAVMRFISVEPMLGPVDLHLKSLKPTRGYEFGDATRARIHWVLIGCESGPKRRECRWEWVLDLVRQCKASAVPVFVKQMNISDRVEHDPAGWPVATRVRQWPKFLQPTEKRP